MIDWLEIRSRWSKLRELGQSNLVRSSVLMPAFGYLLLLNDQIHGFLVIKYDVGWPLRYLPSLWRIWLLFYGSFFLAIASILFSWRCPSEIKRYASPIDLVEAEIREVNYSKIFQDRFAKRLGRLYSGMSQWENSLFKLPKLKPDLPNLGASTTPELQTGDHWGLGLNHIWTVSDIKRPIWRIAIFILFWAGLLCVGFPAAVTFAQVTLVATKHLIAQIPDL
jgi:hypothetical protein